MPKPDPDEPIRAAYLARLRAAPADGRVIGPDGVRYLPSEYPGGYPWSGERYGGLGRPMPPFTCAHTPACRR